MVLQNNMGLKPLFGLGIIKNENLVEFSVVFYYEVIISTFYSESASFMRIHYLHNLKIETCIFQRMNPILFLSVVVFPLLSQRSWIIS